MADIATDEIADAGELPSGAEFIRCALQVNPHHYGASYRSAPSDGDSASYASKLIASALELEIGAIAITDHNSVRDIAAFQAAAIESDLTVLPGFEIESTDGIHVLCIYDADTDTAQLERFLGEFGIRETEPSSEPCSKDFSTILATVPSQGGIAVAAHAIGSKGLFQALQKNARALAWRNEHLLAIQIPSSIDELQEGPRAIVRNHAPEYQRAYMAGKQQAIAVVNAKDVARIEDLNDPGATTLIKFSGRPGVEGLRQAFLDPDSRIRLNTDEQPEEHSELVAITWEGGGFLDGGAIHFNPNLNVLIGGRGTGKSTVIESIRYVLDLEPVGDEARNAHRDIVRQVLRSGTKVTLVVRSLHPAERSYRIERTVPNPAIVRNELGEISNLLPADVLPRAEVYGQHEISELTRSRPKLTRLLHRFVRTDADADAHKTSILRELQSSRKSLLDTQAEIEDIQERLAALPQLQETLERFQEAGLEERLRDQSLLVRESQIVESIPERLQPLRDSVATLRQELPLDRAFLSKKALADLPGGSILDGANEVLQELSNALEDATRRIESALKTADDRIEAISSRWMEHKSVIDAEYQAILRDLQKSAIDGEEFIRLRGNIEGLRPLEDRQVALSKLHAEARQRRRNLLDDWEGVKASQFRDLSRAAKRVNKKLRGFVKVEVRAAGDRDPLADLLRDEVGGRLTEAIRQLESMDQLSLPDFVARCRNGAAELVTHYGLTRTQAENLARAGESTFMKIEELELPPTTDLFLNTSGDQRDEVWQSLDQLSKGQKATAVLLLLLLDSDAPLIVDQPEDDLDNRFISEVIVEKMRESKRRRQFVFSTHNANIPVLGDAELILGLDATGEADDVEDVGHAFIDPEHMGSIDSSPVRTLVEEILEGGKDAFERRRRKYGF
ncbi:TrlF family AAA-like ATPase [Candidatus Poriferisodalis sp.]|uniref:TrlF family AAA-like ATPase n=1 Tax=Candidatus Poriferisodalis sp. TaxID=3101277 RepID=UPI003B59CE2B